MCFSPPKWGRLSGLNIVLFCQSYLAPLISQKVNIVQLRRADLDPWADDWAGIGI